MDAIKIKKKILDDLRKFSSKVISIAMEGLDEEYEDLGLYNSEDLPYPEVFMLGGRLWLLL